MALIVAGTNSGCGKSTVTLGLMAALMRSGLPDFIVQPFKAGPDFIDPGLHALVTGRISRNLDLWMCGEDFVRQSLARWSKNADAAIIEGVMGYYDGAERSTAALAQTLGAKVVLVVDAYGMAESAGAIINGFKNFSDAPLHAVIFNRVGSTRHMDRLCKSVRNVEVLGCLPRETDFSIPERHLGLTVAEEGPISDKAIERLAETVTRNIDIKRVAELARPIHNDSANVAPTAPAVPHNTQTRIAVARDRAFSFYYEDNLDALREAGAEIIAFSPLEDISLPESAEAVYLGGGYPEMFSGELEANDKMRESIRKWVESGRPLYAECGGLMYLGRSIMREGRRFNMCDALPVDTELMRSRSALGYREIEMQSDCFLGPAGAKIRGHEFHYSRITSHEKAEGVNFNVLGEDDAEHVVRSVHYKKTLASYTHAHWASVPGAAERMIDLIKKAK